MENLKERTKKEFREYLEEHPERWEHLTDEQKYILKNPQIPDFIPISGWLQMTNEEREEKILKDIEDWGTRFKK